MAFNVGAKLAMWEFEDKGGYGVANLTYRRKNKDGGFRTCGYKYCHIYDLAYEALKDVTIPENGHVDIQIAKEVYERSGGNNTFEQAPIETDAWYNPEKEKTDFDVRVYKASVLKVVEGKEKPAEQTKVEDIPVPFEQNVTEKEETSQPTEQPKANNGFVGLDFLNIPEGYNPNLPFT